MPEDLEVFLARMNKQLAKDGNPLLIMASQLESPDTVTTGLLALDIACGGGWAQNQWAEVYGWEGHGKTTVVLSTIAKNQEINPDFRTFWVASENYNADWATINGVDNSRVVCVESNNMEAAYQNIVDAVRSECFDCVVLDSYPALIAAEEEHKGMDEFTMTQGARRTGQFFRKIGGLRSKRRPYVGLFVNQLRDAVGKHAPYGTPTTTPGGKAKNFAFYQRVLVKREEYIKSGELVIGQKNKYNVIKNKIAAPRTIAEGHYYFETVDGYPSAGNFDLLFDTSTMARAFGVVRKAGSWYSYTDFHGVAHSWHGADSMDNALRAEPELYTEIRGLTLETAIARK